MTTLSEDICRLKQLTQVYQVVWLLRTEGGPIDLRVIASQSEIT